jgi:xanthine dehydrogenase accessory factor
MSADTPASSDEVLAAALRWHGDGSRTALATVLRTWGSSPRQPGSQLAVNEQREFVGSVSGGCVEGAVIHEALEVMASGEPKTLDFGVSDEDAWAVGLACGGKVQVYVEPVERPEAELLGAVLEDRREGRGAVLATRLGTREHTLLHPLDEPAVADASEGGVENGPPGANAASPGTATATARASATPSGPLLGGFGTALEDAARDALRLDRSTVWEGPDGDLFLQVYNPPLRMIVVGAVHIAQALAPMAALAGFDVTVVDPRSAFASDARFPHVRLARGWPDEVLPGFGIDHRTAVVTLSHDPKLDDPALEAALRSRAFYVGALGSRRTHARRVERLTDRGFGDDEIRRIHAPVGLDIGAVSPAEIAVSVLAQVVERLRVPGAVAARP